MSWSAMAFLDQSFSYDRLVQELRLECPELLAEWPWITVEYGDHYAGVEIESFDADADTFEAAIRREAIERCRGGTELDAAEASRVLRSLENARHLARVVGAKRWDAPWLVVHAIGRQEQAVIEVYDGFTLWWSGRAIWNEWF